MRIAAILLLASLSLFSCKREHGIDPVFVKTWGLYELADTTFSIPDGYIYVQLDGKGNASGYGGCNNFSGTYSAGLKDGTIKFSRLTSTLLWCDYGELETRFMNALQEANRCKVYNTGNNLMALYRDNTFLATLRVVQ